VDATVNALYQPKETIARITDGEYPTVVFDATGNAKSMMDSFHYVAHGGKLVYVGLVKGEITFSDPEFHKREMTLLGTRNATREDFQHVFHAVSSGFLDVERYITHRADFGQVVKKFAEWTNPESKVIKAVVEL
jgi:threonine dehydrogenase-like Zn-dependent dehydrogenase